MAPDESHATWCTPHTMTPHTTSQSNTAHPARPHHITMPHAVAPHSATPHTTTPHHTHHTTHHNTTQRMHHIATTHTPTAHPQHKPPDEHTCGRQAQLVVYTAQRAAMGKHMSDTELEQVQEWKPRGGPPHGDLAASRSRAVCCPRSWTEPNGCPTGVTRLHLQAFQGGDPRSQAYSEPSQPPCSGELVSASSRRPRATTR